MDGVEFYFRLKTNKLGWFKSSKKKINFFLRPHTSDAGTFRQVFIDRQYEIPYAFEPKTIIDAGANIGLSALYFADRFPLASIVALEPDKDNFEIAVQNTRNNSRIKMMQKGVWNKNVFLEIINPAAGENSFMVKETEIKTPNSITSTDIATIIFEQNWPAIDILKIDIEGSEKELFSDNFEKWIPKTRVIFVEVHDEMKKGCSKSVFKAISQYNFRFMMQHENLIFINEDL